MPQLQNSIPFDPLNPYPLLARGSYSYEAAKSHSEKVDQWLGLPLSEDPPEIEKAQTWSHLSTQQFQTPYCEIRNILEDLQLKPQETLVDLGCGYGRIGFVLQRHFPEVFFQGFEISPTRVDHAQRILQKLQAPRIQIEVADITASNFELQPAEYYFIFDFGHNEAIQKILENLKLIARTRSIQVVGRGRATRHFIQQDHPWLSQVNEPQHTPHYSIYKS